MTFAPSLIDSPTAKAMQESKFTFYPAGSRFIGGARPDSDFDFIALDTPELRKFLEARGFVVKTLDPAYKDCLTNDVVELMEPGGVVIQVQLTFRPLARCNARDIVKQYLREEHLTMEYAERAMVWQNLCSVLALSKVPEPDADPFF